MINQSSIERLKQSIDIVDLVSNYLELKKSGANYKAKCPFHSEKTSSFVVSPSKQIFHCFGCGVGGDAIKFVMDIEKLNYPEAIEKIAFLYNIPLEYDSTSSSYKDSSKLLERVQKWYRENLTSNKEVLEYLKNRGVTQTLIENFGLGYAPKSGLIEFLNSNSIPLPQAKEAGVLQEGERGGLYARLVDRVTFPIHLPSGLIVGFGGRTLGNHPAKYINSPQTKIFNKSQLLYGYHLAKESIYQQKEVIVCEGYFDVIMLHKAGFKRAVATLGTALTREHLPLLKKSRAKVILAYDGDKAGVNAGLKASKLLAQEGFEGGIVLFPDGLDPADMVQNGKIKELDIIFRGAKDFITFVLEKIVEEFDLSNPSQKESAFKEVRLFLDTLSPIIKDGYIPKASLLLNLPQEYFSSKRKTDTAISPTGQVKKDTAWEEIIKSISQDDRLLDEFLNIFSPEMAEGYRDVIEALISGDREHPRIISILIDETIAPLSEENFKKALLIQLERYYLKKLNSIIKSDSISYSYKSYWIRKIKTDILPRIKRGELVVDESSISI